MRRREPSSTSTNGVDTAMRSARATCSQYTNDQPTTTLWYHDHTLGMTRLNVYAAGAGFWLIRDAHDGETGLLSGVLPGPAPKARRGSERQSGRP